MKIVKVIIGLVVGFFATITMFQMFSEESGAGLYGALTGYIIIMAICVWLVYSGSKDKEVMVEKTFNKQSNSTVYENRIESLKELKEKGLLTEQEYEEKIKKVVDDNITKSLEDYTEYKQLKTLYEDDILTKEELETKVEILRSKLRAKNTEEEKGEPYFEELRSFTDKELNYGFEDETGNIVVEPIYEYVDNFREGLSLVRKNRKFGFIDRKGNIIIDIIFDNAKSFKDGFALVSLSNEEFYINKKGEKNGNL